MDHAPHDQTGIEASIAAELERRLAEDDADPNNTIAWAVIETEAQARWQHQLRSNQ